jgi:hypothetical protein
MTRPFAALERFLERLLERPAARLFRAPLQPVQLQRRLERTMDAGRVFSADRTYVPNRYRVALNPVDFVAFETYRGTVEGELAEALHQKARARGYRLLARPEVTLVPSDRVDAGDIRVTADLLDASLLEAGAARKPLAAAPPVETRTAPAPMNRPVAAAAGALGSGGSLLPVQHPPPFITPPFQAASAPAALPVIFTPAPAPAPPDPVMAVAPTGPPQQPQPSEQPDQSEQTEPPPEVVAAHPEAGTALYPVPPANAPMAIVEIRTLAGPSTEFTFSGGAARVGRAWENEIVLPDDRVSRQHAQLTTRHGALVYRDLGSTNGSFVNGVRVSEIALGSGDVVRLGNSTLTIKPHH